MHDADRIDVEAFPALNQQLQTCFQSQEEKIADHSSSRHRFKRLILPAAVASVASQLQLLLLPVLNTAHCSAHQPHQSPSSLAT
jgi:hypothetical protein